MNDAFAMNTYKNLRERTGKTRKIKYKVIYKYCMWLNELHVGKFLKVFIFIVPKLYLMHFCNIREGNKRFCSATSNIK